MTVLYLANCRVMIASHHIRVYTLPDTRLRQSQPFKKYVLKKLLEDNLDSLYTISDLQASVICEWLMFINKQSHISANASWRNFSSVMGITIQMRQ